MPEPTQLSPSITAEPTSTSHWTQWYHTNIDLMKVFQSLVIKGFNLNRKKSKKSPSLGVIKMHRIFIGQMIHVAIASFVPVQGNKISCHSCAKLKASFPVLHAFIAWSMKFAQKARSSHDMCHSMRFYTSIVLPSTIELEGVGTSKVRMIGYRCKLWLQNTQLVVEQHIQQDV